MYKFWLKLKIVAAQYGINSDKPVKVDFDFDLNQELVDKYSAQCRVMFDIHIKYMMAVSTAFGEDMNSMSIQDYYPCVERMAIMILLYAVISEMTHEDGLSFDGFMSRMDFLEHMISARSPTELHNKIFKKLRSVDWNLFSKDYISHAQKNDELGVAIRKIDQITSANGFFDFFTGPWESVYEHYYDKAVMVNSELHKKELFNTVPEKVMALALISKRMGVMSNAPMYNIGGMNNISNAIEGMEVLLKRFYEGSQT